MNTWDQTAKYSGDRIRLFTTQDDQISLVRKITAMNETIGALRSELNTMRKKMEKCSSINVGSTESFSSMPTKSNDSTKPKSPLVASLASAKNANADQQLMLGGNNPPPGIDRQSKDYWNWYRIGDGIKQMPKTAGCETYPDSILCDYLKQTDKKYNMRVLKNVVEARTRARLQHQENSLDSNPDVARSAGIIPERDAIVVHLRLGDGLCAQEDPHEDAGHCVRKDLVRDGPRDCWHNAGDCFKEANYAHPQEWYKGVIQALKHQNATAPRKLYVVSESAHWTRTRIDPRNGNFSIDDTYRDNFMRYMKQQGFDVYLYQSGEGTPDDDFIFMCMAHTFVQAGGGFSRLVAQIVRARGNEVLVPAPP